LCREVISTSKPIRDVADAYGVGTETLRNWLIKYRDANAGTETELTVPERAPLRELEREVQQLEAEAQFLKTRPWIQPVSETVVRARQRGCRSQGFSVACCSAAPR
jgi:transposase